MRDDANSRMNCFMHLLPEFPIDASFPIGSSDLTYTKNSVTHQNNSEPPVKSRKVVILPLGEEEVDGPC
jgi:hypothetical protein